MFIKSQNDIYGNNNAKGLAEGVKKYKAEEIILYLIALSLTINLALLSDYLIIQLISFNQSTFLRL